MLTSFSEWIKKYQDAGGGNGGGGDMAGAANGGSSAPSSSNGTNGSSPMTNGEPSTNGDSNGDHDDGDDDNHHHHHHGFGFFPWWLGSYRSARNCKNGQRKDGKCRKKKKKYMQIENGMQPSIAVQDDDPELNGLIKPGKHIPMKHRSPKIEKLFGEK